MKHTLITFLGIGEYDPTIYTYNNILTNETEHLWYEISSNQTIVERKIDKVVILGTKDSAWESLYQYAEGGTRGNRDKATALRAALDNGLGDSPNEEWDEFQFFLETKNWQGIIIPTGIDPVDQIEILKTIDKLNLPSKSHVSLDITHGLRHLPMLGIIIAQYLEQIRKIIIKGIYYGAYDLLPYHPDQVAPIIKMDGLLTISNWFGALKTFDKDGDYGVFVDLLKADGFDEAVAEDLKGAAFSERAMHLSTETGVVKRLRKVYQLLDDDQQPSLKGVSGLFKDDLQEHLAWCLEGLDDDEQTALYKQQKTLAYAYLDKRNYIQATIFALEAIITKNCDIKKEKHKKKGIHHFDIRDAALSRLVNECDAKCNRNVIELKQLRNHFAHAKTSSETVEISEVEQQTLDKLFKSEKTLRDFLTEKMALIFAENSDDVS